MDVSLFLLTIAIGGLIAYLYYSMTYFKNTTVPHESPLPFIGNMLPMVLRKRHFLEHLLQYYDRWPEAKYYGLYDFLTPVIFVRDLELTKSITVKNFEHFTDHRTFANPDSDPLIGQSLFSLKGDKWREVRSLLTPAFTSSKMRQMFELISDCAKDFADYVAENSRLGSTDTDIKDAFTKYTNDVIATCAFGVSVNSLKDPNNEFYVVGKKAVNFGGWKALRMLFIRMCPNLSSWLGVRIFDEQTNKFFTDLVSTTMKHRDEKGIFRPDMIQLMMESRSKSQLNMTEMTAQAFLFFLAGFESTSTFMSFIAIELGLHQEVQDKLIKEVDELMEQTKGKPTYDQVNAVSYLDAIMFETLRHHTLTGFLDRICVKPFELPPAVLGGKPYTVRPGMNVCIATDGIHHDPQFYHDPKEFNPDRFIGEKLNSNSLTNLSFGLGPRICIGNRFAFMETKLAIIYLLSNCRFVTSSKLKLPLTLSKSTASLVLEGGFWVSVVPRDK